jgi:hypothetical protein
MTTAARDLGAADVLALAAAWYPDATTPVARLASLRRGAPNFVATWLSALALGTELPARLAAELAAVRHRVGRLRSLDALLRAALPTMTGLKGLAVADAYPAGLCRRLGDLDLVVPDRAAAYRLAEVITANVDASVRGVSTFPAPPAGGLMIAFSIPSDDPFDLPLGIDLCTHSLLGNGHTVPACREIGGTGGDAPAGHLVMIAAERLERAFGPRDVFDAAVLCRAVHARHGPAGLQRCHRLAARARILPELGELITAVARSGLPLPAGAVVPPAEVRRARRARLAAFARTAGRHPAAAVLRPLQAAEVMPGRASGPRRRLWQAVDRRLTPTAAVRAQLLGFGLPVAVSGETDLPVLHSPVGDFLMVNSGEVGSAWLDPAITVLDQ